jgi:hypothetical protein
LARIGWGGALNSIEELNRTLVDFGADSRVRELIGVALRARSSYSSERLPAYVRLSPAEDHQVAVYIHKAGISVALSPEDASTIRSKYPEIELEKTNFTTHYLHPSNQELIDSELFEAFVGAIELALNRSASMGFKSANSKNAEKPTLQITCNTCNLSYNKFNGNCFNCS